MTGKFRLIFLKSKKAQEWKAGKWKHTYTNFYPSVKNFHCLSGDYIYIIKLIGNPQIVMYNNVPKGYQDCIDENKVIYKHKAKLVRIISRKLRRCKNG